MIRRNADVGHVGLHHAQERAEHASHSGDLASVSVFG